MPRLVFDTRFFLEHFFSGDEHVRRAAKEFVSTTNERHVSVVTLHELYFILLTMQGRDVAALRTQSVQDAFDVVAVNSQIAIGAAELRNKYHIPMGDSLIAATCGEIGAGCVTDDPHFTKIKEIKSRWI